MARTKAVRVQQGEASFYLFSLKASQLFEITQINRRVEGKEEGYQRVLSPGRLRSVTRYIANGGIVPGVIITSFEALDYDAKKQTIELPRADDKGWIIDGQHRLAGAYEAAKAGKDIELAVAAFEGTSLEEQVELFITINREAKNVPASLYLDLLKIIPKKKTEKDALEERLTDIARTLNAEEGSPFFQRIIFTKTAKAGEIGLVNFSRVMRPLFSQSGGTLSPYTQTEQVRVIDNYFKALQTAFPKPWKKESPIFFKTVGFGAVWRVFPFVFNRALSIYNASNVVSFAKVFKEIEGFDFGAWSEYGSGSAAEISAGQDLLAVLQEAFEQEDGSSAVLKLD